MTALIAGILIEHFIFATRQINFSPGPEGTYLREGTFVLGSILAGTLTRQTAREKDRQAQLATERHAALLSAEERIATSEGVFRDLEKENAVRTELALEGADLGLWEWNVQTNQSHWSHSFYRLHGLAVHEGAAYDLWRSLVDPADIDRVEGEIQTAIQEDRSFSSEYRVIRRDESDPERWILLGGKAVRSEQDTPLTVAGYCIDITRRKRTEAALIHTEKLAAAGRLAASIAHEINNPLDAAMNLTYLARGGVNPEHAAYLDEALSQLDRVANIAKQTLRFTKVSSVPIDCAVGSLLDSVIKLLRPKLELTRTELIQEIRSDRVVPCNPGEIQQILTNIIGNAIDAMGEGGTLRIRINDSVCSDVQRRPGVRITISDSGTGMSPDVLQRMREPFFTTKAEAGTGLGMWVTHELIDRHEGTLTVRTRTQGPQRGTLFSLFLPSDQG